MPELPEVESFRKIIEKTSLGKRVEVIKLQSPNMLLNTSPAKLKKALVENSLKATQRHGKFLFIALEKGEYLMIHFGLTGDVEFRKPGEAPPERFALQLHFKDDSDLFFTDTRKMGKISIINDPEAFILERGYGPDVLKVTETQFLDRIKKRKSAIKSVLMDQDFIAGVGNEYSDEILFQTRIHPSSTTASLSETQLKKIYKTMIAVIKESVKANANRDKLTHMFFLDNRKAGLTCPNCKGETSFQTIGGRSSYFCESCQKLYE